MVRGLWGVWTVQCGGSEAAVCGLVAPRHVGSQFPNKGSNPCPSHCKVDSLFFFNFSLCFIEIVQFITISLCYSGNQNNKQYIGIHSGQGKSQLLVVCAISVFKYFSKFHVYVIVLYIDEQQITEI